MNKNIYAISLVLVYIAFIAYTIFIVPHSLSLLELSDSFLSTTGYTNLVINAAPVRTGLAYGSSTYIPTLLK